MTRIGGLISPVRAASTVVMLGFLSACSALPAFGPTAEAIEGAARPAPSESSVTAEYVLRDISATNIPVLPARSGAFPKEFVQKRPVGTDQLISGEDILEIRIWEVGEDGLFATVGQRATAMTVTVSNSGSVDVPYAGRVTAAGKTVQAFREELLERYRGQAVEPEIAVRILNTSSQFVTVVGDVRTPKRILLPVSGIRLLDVLADTGGNASPNWEVHVTVTRGGKSARLRLDEILARPSNNIVILSGDTVEVRTEERNFSVFGAVGRSRNVKLNEPRPSLARLLAEVGGLDDDAAEANSVFVFRLNDGTSANSGRIPVAYRLDFARPDAFILAAKFEVDPADIVYVATADARELRKFTSTILSPIFGAISGLQGLGN